MTAVPEDEVRRRLAAITNGPWADGAATARRELAPLGKLDLPVAQVRPIALDGIELAPADKEKDLQLTRVLRPHFLDRSGVTDPSETRVRDALDEGLLLAELYELAVETGYLPAKRIWKPARTVLTDLLWSSAARGFVTAYDYVGVPMLAARVRITGLKAVNPPDSNPNSALRFAGFLAHLRAFYADREISAWTRFLDDYIVEDQEQVKLWRYLRGQDERGPARTAELLSGCQRFVTALASAFHILDDEELARFGLIHAYSLAKFFGYGLGESGYARVWARSDSWADTIAASPHLAEDADDKVAKVVRRQFRDQVHVLERTFDAVMVSTKSARQASAATGASIVSKSVRGGA